MIYNNKKMAPKKSVASKNTVQMQDSVTTTPPPVVPHQDAPPTTKKAPRGRKSDAAPKKKQPQNKKPVDEQEGQQKKLSPVSYPLASQVKKTLLEMYPDNNIKNVNETKQVCEAFMHTIVDNVMRGNNIALINYMTFKRVLRQARAHSNPQTGEPIMVDKHYVMGVDIKKDLKQAFKSIAVEDETASKKPSSE